MGVLGVIIKMDPMNLKILKQEFATTTKESKEEAKAEETPAPKGKGP
jgi:hypothetical protein